jgi:glycosyltransferase involved in cell wall biosynthesis
MARPRSPDATDQPLRILHATRAPVGGIFRHILDVANGQAARGHLVGIVTDSITGGERAEAALAEISPRMALGVHRLPIHREPHPSDVIGAWRLSRLIKRVKPDVLHSHGAKAGVFVRIRPGIPGTIRVYTPHGGSLHYSPATLKGKLYATMERALMNRTELFLFESAFARDTFQRVIGTPKNLVRTVYNGVTPDEFEPIVPDNDATDVVYVGEFRQIKGTDILVEAFAKLRATVKNATLTLAGDGEETNFLKAQIERLGLTSAIRMIGHVPARKGFAAGRLLIVPSRGDSMPYVVIEAGAAGMPMLASNVGGIPEILQGHESGLVPPRDAGALATAIAAALTDPAEAVHRAASLKQRISEHFSQNAMVEGVIAGYRDAFAAV